MVTRFGISLTTTTILVVGGRGVLGIKKKTHICVPSSASYLY
jgi:hypothetical protein